MFGKVKEIKDNIVILENTSGSSETNILNYHVVFSDVDRKIVGEITYVTNSDIGIMLIGEIKNDEFISGINKKPAFKNGCRIISKGELELLLGKQDFTNKDTLLLGKSSIYENYKVTCNINKFFSNHFAVLGNTGSGKSCGVARILQNIFYHNKESFPNNAHIILFDVYGEYNKALKDIDRVPGLAFKCFTTDTENQKNLIKIPAYYLDIDDLALLLNATEQAQIPIIEHALKLCFIFTSKEEVVLQYKNDIIAKSLLDILSSGKENAQIRDQIIAVLSKYNTETLNLDTEIKQPGYTRTLRQCIKLDNQGKMNAMSLVVDFLNDYTQVDLNKLEVTPNFPYSLDDLYYAFEFALISEGVFNSSKVYDLANSLKVRLQSIINSNQRKYFDCEYNISKDDYINDLFSIDGKKAQIVNMNFNFVDERFAKILTKLFAKLFYNYATTLDKRATFPIHMILEEAHRYVNQDNDINVIGYNIFDRITKEGRKYGVILGFITQRPSELSPTALSQCSNFIVFRLFHPKDLEIVSSISSNVSHETIEQIKTLYPGNAMTFGVAFNLASIVKFDLPNPMPESNSCNIVENWYD